MVLHRDWNKLGEAPDESILTWGNLDVSFLIRAAQQGDLAAFNRLVAAHQDAVYNLSFRVLLDETAAVEATQAAFQCAFQALGRFRDGSFQLWLMSIAVKVCSQRAPRSQRKSSEAPEALLDSNAAVQRFLDSLPLEARLALVLVDMEGLDYTQAAAVMGVPERRFKRHLVQARQRLATT